MYLICVESFCSYLIYFLNLDEKQGDHYRKVFVQAVFLFLVTLFTLSFFFFFLVKSD